MSPAFSALIWWLIPLAAVVGALAYVLWVTKFQEKFQNETTRSVSQFQRFQSSFRHDVHGQNSEGDNPPAKNLPTKNPQATNSEEKKAFEKEITKPNE